MFGVSESALFEWLFQGAEIKFSPKLSSESVAVPLEVQVPIPWMGRTLELVPFIPGWRQADCPSNQSRLGPCTARTRTTPAQTATSFRMHTSVREIHFSPPSDLSYFLRVDWEGRNLGLGFQLLLTDGQKAWRGKVSEVVLNDEAEELEMPKEKYIQDLQQALTEPENSASYCFTVKPDPTSSCTVTLTYEKMQKDISAAAVLGKPALHQSSLHPLCPERSRHHVQRWPSTQGWETPFQPHLSDLEQIWESNSGSFSLHRRMHCVSCGPHSPWPRMMLYALPPLPLIPRLLDCVREEQLSLILIAPERPGLRCFPNLQQLIAGRTRQLPWREYALL
ncbi:hypothetical protein ILYODFUR_017304 [Ilyodon furcidens]|uniref:XRCC4 N-terminal domain-containing protein n=1 Tax=Ilyodon furcidens TaxID=33524 RepID=A0ABV0V3R9_9TELE